MSYADPIRLSGCQRKTPQNSLRHQVLKFNLGFTQRRVTLTQAVVVSPAMLGLRQSVSDCPQMGQIWEFFRSDFSTF